MTHEIGSRNRVSGRSGNYYWFRLRRVRSIRHPRSEPAIDAAIRQRHHESVSHRSDCVQVAVASIPPVSFACTGKDRRLKMDRCDAGSHRQLRAIRSFERVSGNIRSRRAMGACRAAPSPPGVEGGPVDGQHRDRHLRYRHSAPRAPGRGGGHLGRGRRARLGAVQCSRLAALDRDRAGGGGARSRDLFAARHVSRGARIVAAAHGASRRSRLRSDHRGSPSTPSRFCCRWSSRWPWSVRSARRLWP